MAWYSHWESSFDLSSGGVELSFRNEYDMINLLVETSYIREVDNIVKNISGPHISSRYNVIGSRGLGKSTILNYFAYSLYKEIATKMIIPVHVTMFGTATEGKELEKIFFRCLLEGIFEIPNDIKQFDDINKHNQIVNHINNAYNEYTDRLKKHGSVSLEFIYTACNYQIANLREYFNKIVFIFDGLDKQETDYVMQFFRNTQERINYIINKYDCIFIYAAAPQWRDSLEKTEFSGVKGRSINLRGWTTAEIDSLIRKRLERIGVFNMPFDENALKVLIDSHMGNTRSILQYATTLLHYAAKEHIQNIGSGLAKDIIWDEGAKETFYNQIQRDPNLRYSVEKLRIKEIDNKGDVKNIFLSRQLLNILISMYGKKNYTMLRDINYSNRAFLGITLSDERYQLNINILQRRGCIKRSIVEDFIELDTDVIKLFDYIKELNQSLDALPSVLDSLSSKINLIPIQQREGLLIKDEIRDIFEQHTDIWINNEEIKEYLFDNPRTLIKIQEFFKEKYVSSVNRVIPLMVSQLYTQGQVILDADTATYKWRSEFIDYKTAELFKDKKIIDKIINCRKAISSNNLINFKLECYELYSNVLTNINAIYDNRFDVNNINAMNKLLDMLDIDIQNPVPFKIVVSSLNKTINDIDEAKIIFNNILLIAKKIQRKIIILQSYSEDYAKKIKILKTTTAGFSKQSERDLFNHILLPLVNKHFFKIIETMNTIKINEGYIEKLPISTELLQNILTKATLYECKKCKFRNTIAGNNIIVNCPKDNTILTNIKDVYIISQEIYQAWGVWLEEYVRYVLGSLPIQYISSGITFKPKHSSEISIVEEIDVIILYNGKLIAIECIDDLITKEKNDVDNIVIKMSNLKIFDAIILVYQKVDDTRIFTSQIGKYSNFLYPVLVKKPQTFSRSLLKIIKNIKETK